MGRTSYEEYVELIQVEMMVRKIIHSQCTADIRLSWEKLLPLVVISTN